ncbi:MAG TPA: helix-turn-helix domain-containing protein [Thermomicrobiaceae bacterium]|nr:helix-turn-helix domain-containing protein [Thermomicrobiaceae bacterium]
MTDIMTPEQVADYLQVSRETVYRLIRSGELAAVRIGRTYRIPHAELQAFLRSHGTRVEIRQALFRRALAVGERNPQLDGDLLLEQLEHDEQASSRASG